MTASSTIWRPSPHHLSSSNVARLMKQLGFDNYRDFYAFSIAHPQEYWDAVIRFCGIAWSKPYGAHMACPNGPAFPRWFVGGELNWVDTVLAWADEARVAQQPAIIAEREHGEPQRLTYAELAQAVRAFAAGLAQRGIRRGDRVGLLMENGIEANVSLLGLAYAGAIVVPLFTGFGVDAIVARLGSCEARAILATTGFSRRGRFVDARVHVEAALAQLPSVDFVAWKASPEGPPLQAGELAWHEIAARSDAGGMTQAARMSPDDPFMVIYTSGTTGKPKGPVHTHGGFPLKIAHDAAVHLDISQGDVVSWPADMGWVAGSLVSLSALMRGATLVTYDGAPDFPDWSRMSRLIERHGVTHYGSSPTLIRGLAANAPVALQGRLSSLKLLITAGESIDPEHFIWFQQHFGQGHCPLINYSGGTEVSGGLLSSVVVEPIVPGAFNTPSPGIAVEVVDPDGTPIRGKVGELAILAPFVGMAKSFWRDDARYLETYWNTVPGMWIHGDLAMRDDDSFFIPGRSDDTLKVAGKRLGPGEVEAILLEMPEVGEVAAIGAADPVKGQKLVVVLTAAPPWQGDVAALSQAVADHVEARMGKPFRPAAVYVVAQLPKTRSMKVMRRVVRNVYAGLPLGDLSALDNPAAIDELRRIMEPSS